MITSTYKKIHKDTGIIYILVNTENRWPSYEVGRYTNNPNEVSVTFYETYSVEYMPGQFDEEDQELTESIEMHEGFNIHDYVIYDKRNKDQISIVLIPVKLLLDKTVWDELEITR